MYPGFSIVTSTGFSNSIGPPTVFASQRISRKMNRSLDNSHIGRDLLELAEEVKASIKAACSTVRVISLAGLEAETTRLLMNSWELASGKLTS
jgi:hypothetical protein